MKIIFSTFEEMKEKLKKEGDRLEEIISSLHSDFKKKEDTIFSLLYDLNSNQG
jgi:DNA-directed RNA polymerase subunit L